MQVSFGRLAIDAREAPLIRLYDTVLLDAVENPIVPWQNLIDSHWTNSIGPEQSGDYACTLSLLESGPMGRDGILRAIFYCRGLFGHFTIWKHGIRAKA